MDPELVKLFREMADRSPADREDYYRQHRIPAALRTDVESLLRFDTLSSADSLDERIGAAPADLLLGDSETSSAIPPRTSSPFAGTARFDVRRTLGAGAFGTVYQVWDRDQRVTVAAKVLHRSKPDLLSQFKREFRALVDVRHPHLVRLYELFSETDQWFFTMELVDGGNFLDHVRPGSRRNLNRLRDALFQLAEGIHALHEAQRLHLDVKPANALVTREGRVVLLDFSLVHEMDALIQEPSVAQGAGTPAYMAPEQIDGHASEAADWYSVGVMLFQALTGVLPHSRSGRRLWTIDVDETSVDPRPLDPDVPADLGELCMQLLKRHPEERPDGETVLAALRGATPAAGGRATAARDDREPFVGRAEPLRQLDAAFADTQTGRLNVVLMHGASGIGKTVLVRRFLNELSHREPNAVVLAGRCYEFESVPYKGLDALVDEFGRYLQRLPAAWVEAMLPRDASLLPKLFPVLSQVAAIAAAPGRPASVPDVQELRQRIFRALRELLARLSERQPLVIWIDDLQWGDRDSSTFLAALSAPPRQPPLLLILTYRSDEADSGATIAYLHHVLANQRVDGRWHDIRLNGLDDVESRQLLHHILPEHHQLGEEAQTTIVEEARGHPMFLQQLARFAKSPPRATERIGQSTLTLQTVLQDRVGDLPLFAREVLELACVAAQPLTPATLFLASEVGDPDDRAEALALLVSERLARSASADTPARRHIEPFHDQVRAAVVGLLTPDLRRSLHARLARTLSQQPDVEPQVLLTHYQEAGDRHAAFHAALEAARVADGQLAFDRAATFYRAAIDAGDLAPENEAPLYRTLANTLALAGRGRESAQAYLKAADYGVDNGSLDRIDLTRRAAEQLLISGNTDGGLVAIRSVLQAVHLRFPESARQALLSLAFRRLLVTMRGLRFHERRESQLSNNERILIDTCWSAAVGLSMVDTIRGADFQSRHLLLALDAGEPFRVARALAMEIGHRAVPGRRVEAKVKKLIEYAHSVAARVDDPYPSAMCALGSAVFAWLNGRWKTSLERADAAQQILKERCASPSWETVTAQIFSMGALVRLGDLNTHRQRMPELMQAVHERGNTYGQISLPLLSYAHVITLADDAPEQAAGNVRRLVGGWTTAHYDLQRFWGMYAQCEIALYLGDAESAWKLIEANSKHVRDSLLLRVQTIRICWLDVSARSALAAARSGRIELLRVAQRLARRLQREGVPWARGLASLVRAGAAACVGDTTTASTMLACAEDAFFETDMRLHAGAAHWARGWLAVGHPPTTPSGDGLLGAAGVRCPSSMVSMLAPGPWSR